MTSQDQKAEDLFTRVNQQVVRFMHVESAGGLILVAATITAMLVKNSPLAASYVEFLLLEGQVRLGSLDVNKPLFLWVNDFWMAIFFFVVGLELRKEWLFGHLKDPRQVILPAIGAIGGVIVPAAIYVAINRSSPESLNGWAIPTATDIAFALAVLSLLSDRIPASLKIFLMTLAIIDDLIAIIIIAIFYTGSLSTLSLASGLFVVSLMGIARALKIQSITPYLVLGCLLWVCVLKSGVHATLAGVLTAFILPVKSKPDGSDSNLENLIEDLHPWVAFLILPGFAFVNGGIDFSGMNFDHLLTPLPLGIFFGLTIGKVLGVFTFSGIAIKLGLASLPAGCNWTQLAGVGLLCGVGFTMCLFIGGLALADAGVGYARTDRLAIILGSGVSALAGYLVLRWSVGPARFRSQA